MLGRGRPCVKLFTLHVRPRAPPVQNIQVCRLHSRLQGPRPGRDSYSSTPRLRFRKRPMSVYSKTVQRSDQNQYEVDTIHLESTSRPSGFVPVPRHQLCAIGPSTWRHSSLVRMVQPSLPVGRSASFSELRRATAPVPNRELEWSRSIFVHIRSPTSRIFPPPTPNCRPQSLSVLSQTPVQVFPSSTNIVRDVHRFQISETTSRSLTLFESLRAGTVSPGSPPFTGNRNPPCSEVA